MDWWIDESAEPSLDPNCDLDEYADQNPDCKVSRLKTSSGLTKEYLYEPDPVNVRNGDSFEMKDGLIQTHHINYMRADQTPKVAPGQMVWIVNGGNVSLTPQEGASQARVVSRNTNTVSVTYWL